MTSHFIIEVIQAHFVCSETFFSFHFLQLNSTTITKKKKHKKLLLVKVAVIKMKVENNLF